VSSVALVWLVVGLVTAAAVAAVIVGLVRHVLVLFRSFARFQEEVAPTAAELAAQGRRAADRSERLSAERSFGRGPGRTVR
jgi:hypothetical protein